MGNITRIPLLIILLFLLPYRGYAHTWYVEQDGSGDFTVIQDAVSAASSGDTIQIGVGRYIEYQFIEGQDTYVFVDKDNLTFIGAGDSLTIIGPEEPIHDITESPRGFLLWLIGGSSIAQLSIENVYSGIGSNHSGLSIQESTLMGCEFAIFGFFTGGLIAHNCSFLYNIDMGIQTLGPTENVEIENCYFTGSLGGASFENGSIDVAVINSQFDNLVVGVQFAGSSNGEIRQCSFQRVLNFGIVVKSGSNAVLNGNILGSTGGSEIYYNNLRVGTGSHVFGSGNILYGGLYTSILICNGQLSFNGNHIFREGGYFVRCECYVDPPIVELDLTNNYWGTLDPEEIPNWIWDDNDDPSIHAIVLFEPISDPIVSVETPEVYHTDNLMVIPNPFNPQTNITYTLSQDGLIRLAVYDLMGRKVAVLIEDYRPAGPGSVIWDGRDASGSAVASGVYIARLETTTGVSTQKLVLAR